MLIKLKLNRKQLGFTAIEMMVVVAILGILTTLALPSFQDTLERRHLVAAAESIASDLRWARSEAIKRNTTITVTFAEGSSWSYEINSAANPVVDPIVCPPPDTSLKAVCGSQVTDFKDVSLATSFSGDNTGFDSVRGVSLDNGTVTLTSSIGTVAVTVSNLGRVRVCSNDGIGGYEGC